MPVPKAQPVTASEPVRGVLEKIERRRTAPQWLVTRVQVIRLALTGQTNTAISESLGLDRGAVRKWRERWAATQEQREAIVAEARPTGELEKYIIASLRDAYRSGTPATFSAEQIVEIVSLACEDPLVSGYPISHWTPKEVATEAIRRGIVDSISPRQVGRFLKRSGD